MQEPTWGPLSGSRHGRFRDRHEAGRALATRLLASLRPGAGPPQAPEVAGKPPPVAGAAGEAARRPEASGALDGREAAGPEAQRVNGTTGASEVVGASEGLVVLGLPRGGVPVAAEIARKLRAPLDVIVVRKLGVPYQPELAMGAIGEGGVRILNKHLIREGQVSEAEVAQVEKAERARLDARLERYRSGRPGVSLEGRTVVVVDDGAATGATARAACQVARAHGAARVVLALPVAAPQVAAELREVADEVVCLHTPSSFQAVGQWYEDFSQTSDEEVEALLRR